MGKSNRTMDALYFRRALYIFVLFASFRGSVKGTGNGIIRFRITKSDLLIKMVVNQIPITAKIVISEIILLKL